MGPSIRMFLTRLMQSDFEAYQSINGWLLSNPGYKLMADYIVVHFPDTALQILLAYIDAGCST